MVIKRGTILKGWIAIAITVCMSFVAICGGRVICFCDDNPDGCGEPCHVCGERMPEGLSAGDTCNHFSFIGMDFLVERRASAPVGCPALRGVSHKLDSTLSLKLSTLTSRTPAARANAPPGMCTDSELFRARRVLLLS